MTTTYLVRSHLRLAGWRVENFRSVLRRYRKTLKTLSFLLSTLCFKSLNSADSMEIRHPSTIAKSLLHKPAVSHSEKGTMDPNKSISYRSGLFPISKQNITEVLVFGWDKLFFFPPLGTLCALSSDWFFVGCKMVESILLLDAQLHTSILCTNDRQISNLIFCVQVTRVN